ncbi:hypothetical protein VOLCADRAFT_95713 [Volvox carteri f. nagariensis]|uniref:Importin N-terminal domain-containing protein n=1 Tax=Volvox carteri f. nagariensis TaxID=3068 RepID=D8U868_VOLCA|nr:uncharacterized protein VOLCADRAFT_95713 [Volvox carteri f. nagariensis]EFJ44088.1 hypothetical protein VOLCADRAFT_95713 [Volvox carteri f. nagariensis]|eukprot:XP_002954889.1 hypothetical protein VOLCADRAFT_95713 [Volvox carteri f. nagariensis]
MSQPLSQQDYNSLLSCLLNALNPNPEVQKQAEAYLQSLDSRPGFSSALAEIVSNREADHSARYLASVHLKNSVHRNWKKRVSHASISPEEKAHLRATLSKLIPQDDNQNHHRPPIIYRLSSTKGLGVLLTNAGSTGPTLHQRAIAVQVALVYAKVARFDYPAEWPGLFSDLMLNLGSANPLTVRRVYLILHHVLKELSSKRLVADQANFAQVTELLFGHVWGQWCSDTQLLLSSLPAGLESAAPPQPLLQSCERWMLLLKILRRLILHGFPSDARTLAPVAAAHSCCPHMGLLDARPRGRVLPRSHLQAMLERAILKLLKTLAQVLEVHPWSFHGAGVLLPTMDMCTNQLLEAAAGGQGSAGAAGGTTERVSGSGSGGGGGGGAAGSSQERRLTQCCALLVTVMSCKSYKGSTGSLDTSGQPRDTSRVKQMAAEVRAALQNFWAAPVAAGGPAAAAGWAAGGVWAAGSSRLVALVGALVCRHMVLSKSDLEQWRDSPEEFAHSHAGGAWQDSLALAAEQLYLAGAPPGTPADSLGGERLVGVPMQILHKDSVYGALAAGAYELHDYLDFRAWLTGSLLQARHARLCEVGDVGPANKPIRRRIGLVVAANVDRVEQEDPVRPALYGAMLGLMSEPDAAVALSGIGALTALVGDFSFTESPFAPLLPSCLQLLLRLMGGTEDLDTQKQAFGLLNLVIQRCDETLAPHVMPLVSALPALWERAAGQTLLRIQIMEAVQRLVNLTGSESPALYPLVMPLLGYSLDLGQPEVSEGLLEDGLALWLVALRNAPSCCEPDPAAAAAAGGGGGGCSGGGPGGGGGGGGPLAVPSPPSPAVAAPCPVRVVPGREGTLQALLSPFPALAVIAEASTEHLPLVSAILSSAALVSGPMLYSAVGQHVLAVLLAIVGNVSERGMLLILPTLEAMLSSAPQAAATALQPVLTRLVGMMLGGKESSLVVSNSWPVLARMILVAPQQFGEVCSAVAAAGAAAGGGGGDAGALAAAVGCGRESIPADLAPSEVVLWRLLELWAEQFDSIGQAGSRRLCALALCRALALPSRVPLGLLEVLLPAVTAVWYETEGGGGGGFAAEGGMPLSYDFFSAGALQGAGEEGMERIAGPALDSEEAEGEVNRRAQSREADPASYMRVGPSLRDGLAACAALHGPSLDAALARLDEHVMSAVRTATSGGGVCPYSLKGYSLVGDIVAADGQPSTCVAGHFEEHCSATADPSPPT